MKITDIKGGSYLETEQFKNICLDFDVFGVDYNDYFPWIVKNKIMEVYDKISEKYDYIYVLANSIGAYFTMHTLQNFKIEKALFISPILDMEQLIVDMMSWANVSEKELSERKEIPTDFGETLSWEYLCLEDFSKYVFGMSYQTIKDVMKQQKGREEQCRKQGCWWKRKEQLAKKQHHTGSTCR